MLTKWHIESEKDGENKKRRRQVGKWIKKQQRGLHIVTLEFGGTLRHPGEGPAESPRLWAS